MNNVNFLINKNIYIENRYFEYVGLWRVTFLKYKFAKISINNRLSQTTSQT